MKKMILGASFLIILVMGTTYLCKVSSLVRGARLRTLAEQLAHYLVENDYQFPKNWTEYENFHAFGKAIDGNFVRHSGNGLDNKFSLPWGESATNRMILTNRCWFKSIDRPRPKEDAGVTHLTMSFLLQFTTNEVIVSHMMSIYTNSINDP